MLSGAQATGCIPNDLTNSDSRSTRLVSGGRLPALTSLCSFVPSSVSPRQARLALSQLVCSSSQRDDPCCDEATQITWDYATVINRDDRSLPR